MAGNRGIAPPDMGSNIGKFRALAGDIEFSEYEPPQPGFGMYSKFSDAEIEGFLAVADGVLEGALYLAYMQLAGQAALESRSVKDFDLQVDLTKRATDLRLIAQDWRDRADSLSADVFELADVSIWDSNCTPELAAKSYGGGCGFRLF